MKKGQTFKLLGLAVFVSLAFNSRVFAEETKIATVDMQKALQSVESGKKAKAQLESDFNLKKEKLQVEESSIKKMTEEFKKQSLVMNDEARNKKQAQLQERILKFQELTARSQSEIQQKERELTQPIINKLKEVISKAAKDKAYTLVLEKNDNKVLFSMEKDDLTSEVISNFNRLNKSDASSKGKLD